MGDNNLKGQAAFVIPYWSNSPSDRMTEYLDRTIAELYEQTDDNWCAIVIDDCSSCKKSKSFLRRLETLFHPKISVLVLPENKGPGYARNIGIRWAKKRDCPFVLFNDADDLSHSNRVKVVREIFAKEPEAQVVYSTFSVIDEDDKPVPHHRISTPILEILESHQREPLQGEEVWISMATQRGYTNKTSSTSVRTEAAYYCPFPSEFASEDYHTWMRLSAQGHRFCYEGSIPTRYRIPSYMKYQASRTRIGLSNFNQIKTRVDTDGFDKAIEIALNRKTISPENVPILRAQFLERLAKSMKREKEYLLAEKLLLEAQNLYCSSENLNQENHEETNIHSRNGSFA